MINTFICNKCKFGGNIMKEIKKVLLKTYKREAELYKELCETYADIIDDLVMLMEDLVMK